MVFDSCTIFALANGESPGIKTQRKNFLKKVAQKFGVYQKKVLSLHHFRFSNGTEVKTRDHWKNKRETISTERDISDRYIKNVSTSHVSLNRAKGKLRDRSYRLKNKKNKIYNEEFDPGSG